MPKKPLLMMAILTFRFSCLSTISSCRVIWKPPSPATAQTSLSGLAISRADGRGQRVAHGAQTATGQQHIGVVVDEILTLPHLVLAHIGDHDGEAAGALRVLSHSWRIT